MWPLVWLSSRGWAVGGWPQSASQAGPSGGACARTEVRTRLSSSLRPARDQSSPGAPVTSRESHTLRLPITGPPRAKVRICNTDVESSCRHASGTSQTGESRRNRGQSVLLQARPPPGPVRVGPAAERARGRGRPGQASGCQPSSGCDAVFGGVWGGADQTTSRDRPWPCGGRGHLARLQRGTHRRPVGSLPRDEDTQTPGPWATPSSVWPHVGAVCSQL